VPTSRRDIDQEGSFGTLEDSGRPSVSGDEGDQGRLLAAVASHALGLTPANFRIALRPPLDHQSNRLYDVWTGQRHLIAKEFIRPAEIHDAPAREFRALQRLASLGIAPRPVFFDPALGPVVMYEYLEGEIWDRRKPTPSDLTQLAELWLTVNAVPTDGLGMPSGYDRSFPEHEASFHAVLDEYVNWTTSEFPKGRRAAMMCAELVETRHSATRSLQEADPATCFSRADQRFANVIRQSNGRLGMINWEDSGLRDPIGDLADLLTHANQEDLLAPDEWQAFLRPYLRARGAIDSGTIDRLRLYLGIFPLLWLMILIRGGMRRVELHQLVGWTVNGLPANQRLRRYLARAIAWPEPAFDRQLVALAEVMFFPD